MSAETNQMLRAGPDCTKQTEAVYRTGGTPGDAVFGTSCVNHNRGAMVNVDNSRCYYAYYAGVPSLASEDETCPVGVVESFLDYFFTSLLKYLPLALSPLVVLFFEFLGYFP